MFARNEPSPIERYNIWLNQQGKRQTKQRRLILEQIISWSRPFAADELVGLFAASEGEVQATRPTVFRTLCELVDCGLLHKIHQNGSSIYELDR